MKYGDRYISRSQFAQRCRVARSAVTLAIGRGIVDAAPDGPVDLHGEATKIYMAQHGLRPDLTPATVPDPSVPPPDPDDPAHAQGPEKKPRARRRAATTTSPATLPTAPPASMDRAEIELRKKWQETIRLELMNAREYRRVVSRDLVERMIGVIDTALNRIIMDGGANMIPQLHQKVQAGATVEEAQMFYRDECGKYISPVKPHLKKLLREDDRNTD